jgi:RNA ligase
MRLLTRDAFRTAVFARDQHRCVICGTTAPLDAHHIIERRLWSDGGYYIDNGASLCAEHHIAAEQTTLSADAIREAARIFKVCIPPHLYDDQSYDKWGNIIQANGTRLKGELFFDESVQKILREGQVLHLFVDYVKYPRTHHLPWSLNINNDDRVISSLQAFFDQRVIVTEKMDGENTTLYRDYIHARSIDGRHHDSRNWVKQFWGSMRHDIPAGWRVCGENMYAQHSIHYNDLPSYFLGFSIWDDRNVCLDWDTTQEWFTLLGITTVPVLYDAIYHEHAVRSLYEGRDLPLPREGYVMRRASAISYGEFRHTVAKFVRKDHIQTVKHWMYGQPIVPNEMLKIVHP